MLPEVGLGVERRTWATNESRAELGCVLLVTSLVSPKVFYYRLGGLYIQPLQGSLRAPTSSEFVKLQVVECVTGALSQPPCAHVGHRTFPFAEGRFAYG